MPELPAGYTRAPRQSLATPEEQAAALLKIHHSSLPKLAKLRILNEQHPTMPLCEKSKLAEVGYATAQRWRKAGLLDPDNYKLQLTIAQRLGPELQQVIAENAAGLMIEGQRQVLRRLPEASAKEASKIVTEQQQVAHLATGQATAIVSYTTREELIAKMRERGLIADAPEEIEGEFEEEADAA